MVPDEDATNAYINEPTQGFPLLGADNTGKCFSVKDSISGVPSSITEFYMTDFKDLKYIEDPLLTFEDSILTGCHLDLTYDELRDFCTNKKF